MKEVLKIILPKIGIARGHFQIIDFQGAGNLEKSLERQIRAVLSPGAGFLVLRDNDRGNCVKLKEQLLKKVVASGRKDRTKVRIVCQMLESWFIGDSTALEKSGYLKKKVPKRLRVCDPDLIGNPKKELMRLREGYGEISGAKAIAPFLDAECNRSASFRHTIKAIRDLIAA